MSVNKQTRNRKGQADAERSVRDIEQRGGLFVEAVEATRMPMAVTDPSVADNPIIYANAAFLELCGYQREEVLGQNYFFLVGEHSDPEVAKRIQDAMAARRQITEDVQFHTKDGREIWVSMFVSPVIEDNRVVRHFASFIEITERVERERHLREAKEMLDHRVATRTKKLQQANARLEEEIERRRRTEALLRDALEQDQEDLRFRDFLIREVNHRTKNALQMAVSLLSLQARHSDDPACCSALESATGRLQRIAEVHALLTYRGEAPDIINLPDYLHRICREMAETLAASPGQVQVEVEVDAGEDGTWSADLAVPLGLIVGEAVTNALKHAFPEGREGRILIELHAKGGGLMRLRVEDNGVGMPPKRRGGSLGLRLIEMFARQIKGKAAVEDGPDGNGTLVMVTFPAPNHATS